MATKQRWADSSSYTLCESPKQGQRVHVEGWDPRCVFKYVEHDNGEAVLVTPKNHIEYRTRNRLLLTRKDEPE